MLHAGYVFCHRCGHATEEAFYHNGSENIWVQLKRTVFGKFTVEQYMPTNAQGQTTKIDRFVLQDFAGNPRNGLPHTISVECRTAANVATLKFKRSCPFCIGKYQTGNNQAQNQNVQDLIPGMGQLPTYVIGVIGARTVGKSCWIHALSCPTNTGKLNSQREGGDEYEGYVLVEAEVAEDKTVPPEETPLNSLGNTRFIKICKKRGREHTPVAQVLVLDFAGELFALDRRATFEETTAHIFKGGVGYSGVDAVVFMMDPTDLGNDAPREQYSLANTYNVVNGDWGLLTQKPVAFVLNKVDLLFANPPTVHINNDENEDEVPLFTSSTFGNQGMAMYQKQALLPRIALQTAVLRRMSSLVNSASQRIDCAGFLVKATDPVYNAEGALTCGDFTKSINVMDPLLWILNKLDVFPLDDQIN